QLGDIDLPHLKHCFHNPFCFLWFPVIQHFAQCGQNDLPVLLRAGQHCQRRQPRCVYELTARSVTALKFANPCSNFSPTILSQFTKSPIALPAKLFCPAMVQVTKVLPPSGLKLKVAVFVAWKGFVNSSLISMNSLGRLSMIVMHPSLTFLLPDQA